MTNTNTSMPTDKPKRWMPLTLLVSGILNLLLIGLVGGHWYYHRTMMFHHGFSAEHTFNEGEGRRFEGFLSAVPADKRDDVRALMQKMREARQANFEKIRRLRDEADKAFVAEPFDRAKFQAAFQALRTQSETMQDEYQATLMDIAAKLPPEARQKLADLRRPGGGWRPGADRRPHS